MVYRNASGRARYNGFGLIEVLIGMLIGLITILVIFQVFAVFEGQKRTTGSTGDTQMNGAQAMMLISRDLRNAGYGFGVAGAQGCQVNASFNGTSFTFNLVPVTIIQGSGTAADSLQIMAGDSSSFSVPARITFDHPPTAINFCVDTTAGINPNDMMIAYEPGKTCTLLQATSVGADSSGTGQGCTQTQVKHQNSAWNPTGNAAAALYPQPDGYTTAGGAQLFDLGQFVNRTYFIGGTGTVGGLQLTEWNTAVASGTSVGVTSAMLVSDVVNLQAEYGKDTNGDGAVDTWDTITPTDNTGWQQVLAVRYAIALRSPLYEKTVVTQGNVAATWPASASGVSGSAGSIALDLKPDGTAMPDWNHYRYTVMYAVVPLRNMIWRQ